MDQGYIMPRMSFTFCNICGILLVEDSGFTSLFKKKEKGNLCKACSLVQSLQRQKTCNCEFCYSSCDGTFSKTIEVVFEDDHQQRSSPEAHHPQEDQEMSSDDTSFSFEFFEDEENKSWTCDAEGTDWNFPQELKSVEETKSPESKLDNDGGTEEDTWMVCVKGKHVRKERKEDQVSEEIATKWAEEQAQLLKELSEEDTSIIAELVSGKRRKRDGRRFYIGGVDISFYKDNKVEACACLSVIQMPDLELVYQRMEIVELTQPYFPGFLAFREVPPLSTLFTQLKKNAPQYIPDVVMVDGNGILHPRGFGLASHLGVVLGIPTIGVAKTLISAQGISDDPAHKRKKQTLTEAGQGFDLVSATSGRVMGKCVRAHDDAPNPIYVSIGHNICLASAVWLALETSKFRIPEPVRRADLDSREYIRENKHRPIEFIKK